MLRCLLICLFLSWTTPLLAAEYQATVEWIYDGDSLRVDKLGKVRLLGIDVPESQDSHRDSFYKNRFKIDQKHLRSIAKQAKQYNIDNLKGAKVRLVTDFEEQDKHGRLLAYVYLPDGSLLNRTLLKKGLATVFRRYQFSLKEEFLGVEQIARESRIGIWSQ